MKTFTDSKKWEAIWWTWIVYFVVAERQALKNGGPKAPLSYFLRRRLGVHHNASLRFAGQVAAGAGIVWVIGHLWNHETKV